MLSTGVARKPEEEFGGKRRGQPEELERPVRLWTASGCGEVHWERTCGAHFLRSFARNFAVGAGVKTLLNVVGFLLRKRRKGKGVPKRPVSKLLKLVELRWGFFLGALAGVWKAVSCLSRRAIIAHAGADPCDLDQVSALQPRFAVADLLAGATTGLGLFFIRPEDRRTLALYSLVRSTEFLAAFLARRELLPTWLLRCFTQLDLLIMCATAGQVLYAYAFEADTLTPSYRNFLYVHGAKEPRVINLIKQTHFGEPLTTKDLKSFCRERQVDWEVAHQSLLDFNICTILHPHQTCVTHFLTLTWEGFKRALPLYAPLHIVTTLVVLLAKLTSQVKERVKRAGSFLSLSRSLSTEDFVEAEEMLMMQEAEPQSPRSPRSRTDLIAHQVRSLTAGVLRMFTKQRLVWTATYTLSILRRLIFNIIRSSLFLGFYCSGAWLAACFAHNMSNVRGPFWVRFHLAAAGLSCLIEAKSRRIELAMYCIPHALNSAVNEAIKYNKLPQWLVRLRHLDVVFFCMASAITVFCFKNDPKSIRPSFYFLMKWLWA